MGKGERGEDSYTTVERLGAKIRAGELTGIKAVATSIETEMHARELGIDLTTIDDMESRRTSYLSTVC